MTSRRCCDRSSSLDPDGQAERIQGGLPHAQHQGSSRCLFRLRALLTIRSALAPTTWSDPLGHWSLREVLLVVSAWILS